MTEYRRRAPMFSSRSIANCKYEYTLVHMYIYVRVRSRLIEECAVRVNSKSIVRQNRKAKTD